MKKEQIVDLLRKDMRGEHQAIIQYLNHAYALGEGEIACEIEAIAREEMRHLDWLADEIVELGGDPSMERDPVDLEMVPPGELLEKDVDLEQVAIDQYQEHMEAIDDPEIRRLLARIVHDERAHQGQFRDLVEEAREQMEAGEPPEAEAEAPKDPAYARRLQEIMNEGIRHEYSVVLQYLFHSFLAEDKEVAEELENAAINEMQHMGWLAEEQYEHGGDPDYSHGDLVLGHDVVKNLLADIEVEAEVTEAYSSQLSELREEDLRRLVERIRDHEIYHEAVFKDLLEEVKEEAEDASEQEQEEGDAGESAPREIPSVGSLKDKE
ncbi:MAG: ferritin-like domain-containing protein [Anaerolineales bacterium]